MQYKYFKQHEFDSPDLPGSGCEMALALVVALDKVRAKLGKPMKVNSGYRTEAHNKEVGGVSNSQHRKGYAADIHIDNQDMGDRIMALFIEEVGIKCGIGRYNSFIHLDVRKWRARWDNRTI